MGLFDGLLGRHKMPKMAGMEDNLDDMLKMLAGMPESQRRPMVESRIKMLLSMPEEKRIKGMVDMLRVVNTKLSPAERKGFIKTRTQVVASLPEKDRKTIMAGRMAAGKQLGKELDMQDMKTIEAVLPELPADIRKAFMKTKDELMKSMGA